MTKHKTKKKSAKKPAVGRGSAAAPEEIVIDADKKLIFKNEGDLYKHFQKEILSLEEVFYKSYDEKSDIQEENFKEYEDLLVDTLAQPDYVLTSDLLKNQNARHFTKTYESTLNGDAVYYIAVAYVVEEEPTFVFIHFPTKSKDLYDLFSSGEVLYDAQKEYEEGDALSDGDELAVGLYTAMLKIRSDKDIPESDFANYRHYRDEGIEEPDEIWRDPDLQGNVLVTFIKDYSDADMDLFYLSVAVEDKMSDSHVLLFSFPTNDKHLVDRYRHGENLHAEEIETSDSH